MERIEDLEQRAFAFKSRLDRFLGELGILAPLQRELVDYAAEIEADIAQVRQTRESAHHG